MRSLKEIHKALAQFFDHEDEAPEAILNDLLLHVKDRKDVELGSQLAYIYHYASQEILRLDRDRLMASGVVIQMHHIGGKEACPPFLAKYGLSDETINALLDDIQYSYDKSVEFKPTVKRKVIKCQKD